MKTIEQVNSYLSSCIFNDNDWERVLSYCRSQYGGGNMHRPRRGQHSITFSEFITWVKYLPSQGDIVKVGNVVGIVGRCTPATYTLCAYTGQKGQLIRKHMDVLAHQVQTCTPDESFTFRDLMLKENTAYSPKLHELVRLYIPENGELVTVVHAGVVKHGIFSHTQSSDYVFYCLEENGVITKDAALPAIDCEVEKSPSKDAINLLECLVHNGIMWNSRKKMLKPVPKRAAPDEKYWYINDKFYICQARDVRTPAHNERYANGNYFTAYGEALVFLSRLKDLCAELNKGLIQ